MPKLIEAATPKLPVTRSIALLAPHQIIVRPLVTEKGMHRSTRYNAYAFEVNRMATKHDVRQASKNCSM